jgi:hypothetical protein
MITLATAAWILAIAFATLLQGCSGATADGRYPEKKRPEPARSASDGEVLGAHGQSPEDTLEASPTNLHPAAGQPEEETAPAAEPCVEERPVKSASGDAPVGAPPGDPRKQKRPCVPSPVPVNTTE